MKRRQKKKNFKKTLMRRTCINNKELHSGKWCGFHVELTGREFAPNEFPRPELFYPLEMDKKYRYSGWIRYSGHKQGHISYDLADQDIVEIERLIAE